MSFRRDWSDILLNYWEALLNEGIDDGCEERPDLYIGLVCAAGTDLTDIRAQIGAQLNVVGYEAVEVKVSEVIRGVVKVPESGDEYSRIKSLMDAGDALRNESENGEAVASAVIAQLRRLRNNSENPSTKAYIIDSLKNPAELGLLDQVYGRNYYTISIYRPREDRLKTLKKKIADDRHMPPNDDHKVLAEELINDDEQRKGKKAQNVRDSFPKADFFVDATKDVGQQLKRFVELVFREPFATPTPDEFNMFVAKASALRSSDLSRIVGAAIFHPRTGILSTGCNEVPYPGGGTFFEGRKDGIGDNRDYKEGGDPNYLEIQRTIIEFVEGMISTGHVQTNRAANEIADDLLHGEYKDSFKNLRIRNLIEFGRVVHAEMHAITQAASSGRALYGSTLYCTTFPCHGCARHIIAAGIAEVVFIEPYPKSLTNKLYPTEIEMVNEPLSDEGRLEFKKVRFRPFHGVSPTLFQRVFAMRDRKNDRGIIASWEAKVAVPAGSVFGVERPKTEVTAANIVAEVLQKRKVGSANLKGEDENGEANAAAADSGGP